MIFFAQSMYMIADGLGVTIDEVTSDLKAAVATEDIPHELGCHSPRARSPRSTTSGRPGSTAAHSSCSTRCTRRAARTSIDPAWDWGKTQYRIVIEGDPPTELTLEGVERPDGTMAHPGYDWTAMGAINAIPDVCDAAPGWVNHLDLGLDPAPRSGAQMTEPHASQLHHVVFAVATERQSTVAQMFTELGFSLQRQPN